MVGQEQYSNTGWMFFVLSFKIQAVLFRHKKAVALQKIVVGDIHGCYDELTKLLDMIGPSPDDEIITVGDMIDRGPNSPEVVTFFARTLGAKSCMGNHERKHALFSEGKMSGQNFGDNQRETMRQFNSRNPDSGLLTYNEALDYFKTLPLIIELPEAIVVHAGFTYGVPHDEQPEKIVTGVGSRKGKGKRNEKTGLFYWCDSYPKDAKPIIFGHLGIGLAPWPLPQRENLWPIDTGCVSGGYLTAIVLPQFKVVQLKSYNDSPRRRG